MKNNRCRLQDEGVSAFTLLELIIALSIGTVLILLVSFSIRMGFFQMEKGSKWLEEMYRDNSALHFFSQQASSMRNEAIGEEVIFNGDSEKIVFVTPISLQRRYGLGLMVVSYYLEKGGDGVRLNYREKRFIPGEAMNRYKDQSDNIFDNSEEVEIVTWHDDISFQFLGSNEGEDATSNRSGFVWKDIWLVNSLPKAVKLVLSKDGQDREMLVPVMVMY